MIYLLLNKKISDLSKLKACTDDNISENEKLKLVLGREENLPYFGAYNTHIFSALNNLKLGTACYTLQ